MAPRFSVSIYKPLLLLLATLSIFGCSKGWVRCVERERLALLDFKESFASCHEKLSSWNSSKMENCCTWEGITCDNLTGHVVSLDLRSRGLKSYQLRSSLVELQHLRILDLSLNDFAMKIPYFFGSITKLTELYLSHAGFWGKIPPHLGNLSNIQVLYLSSHQLYGDNFHWVSRLSSLKYLHMNYVNFSEARDWLSTINKLPLLFSFGCSWCSLPPPAFSSPPYQVNSSTSLELLSLPGNQLESGTFKSISNVCNLKVLDAFECSMKERFVDVLQALTSSCTSSSLEFLSFRWNNLTGTIPSMLNFPSLAYLFLGRNSLDSFPPQNSSLPCFPASLRFLDLPFNSLTGVLSDVHFSNLTHLKFLKTSNNPNLAISFSIPSFQLQYIYLSSCKLGHKFPSWLLTQNSFSAFDISSSLMSGSIPTMFWRNLPPTLVYLNLSFNSFSSIVPNLPFHFSRSILFIDLSSNAFYGAIPFSLFKAATLRLSNNNFSSFAPFPHSNSSLASTGPSNTPNVLDISNNHLSGTVPEWLWIHVPKLGALNLANNNLSGTIPNSIGFPSKLYVLSLSNNSFSGPLPLWLKNCTELRILDLSGNRFSGPIPSWMGEDMKNLVLLSLESNDLRGTIPTNLCHLNSLQILDLSHNKMSGNIPDCVKNFSAMAHDVNTSREIDLLWDYFPYVYPATIKLTARSPLEMASFYNAFIKWKGMERQFQKNLQLLKLIDLSSNNLSGGVPTEMTSLLQLKSLDLSSNNLHGSIPEQIGQLSSLEYLNLSHNRLNGQIPSSLSEISSLAMLNFSHNNLSGRIPTGTQLQGFNSSAFEGNPQLCGRPLSIKCPGDDEDSSRALQPSDTNDGDKENDSLDMQCFYAGMGTGFAFGFLAILGALTCVTKLRYRLSQFASGFADVVDVALSSLKITRNLHVN